MGSTWPPCAVTYIHIYVYVHIHINTLVNLHVVLLIALSHLTSQCIHHYTWLNTVKYQVQESHSGKRIFFGLESVQWITIWWSNMTCTHMKLRQDIDKCKYHLKTIISYYNAGKMIGHPYKTFNYWQGFTGYIHITGSSNSTIHCIDTKKNTKNRHFLRELLH